MFIVSVWVCPKIGVPQNGWFIMETLLKLMIWGYPYFWKHPYLYLSLYIYLHDEYTGIYGIPMCSLSPSPSKTTKPPIPEPLTNLVAIQIVISESHITGLKGSQQPTETSTLSMNGKFGNFLERNLGKKSSKINKIIRNQSLTLHFHYHQIIRSSRNLGPNPPPAYGIDQKKTGAPNNRHRILKC